MSFANLAALLQGTDAPRPCQHCGQPLGACICAQAKPAKGNASGARVRVGRESKGRAGKGVTVISGLELDEAALQALATELKKRCGSGGTVRDGLIEIQGEQRDVLIAELARRGINAKRAGG